MSKQGETALAALRNYFPDSAARLAETLIALNKEHNVLPKWRVGQLLKFIEVLKMNAEELERAHGGKKAPTLAWVSRNVLELDVWIDYCNLSISHAKRFNDDAMRDMLGFFRTINSMVTEMQGREHPQLKNAQKILETAALTALGVADDKYLRVDKAAEELGKKEFVYANKMYSKFAHPTAWLVDSANVTSEETCDTFLANAVVMLNTALTKIYNHMTEQFPIAEKGTNP